MYIRMWLGIWGLFIRITRSAIVCIPALMGELSMGEICSVSVCSIASHVGV